MWQKVSHWSVWLKIILLGSFWLVLIYAASNIFSQGTLLPFMPQYADGGTMVDWPLPATIKRLASFDGFFYVSLASDGYGRIGLLQAFFPGYVLLIRVMQLLVKDWIVAGLVVSVISLFGFLFLSYLVVKDLFDRQTAWWFLIISLCLPGSFFLGALYNESLFLCLWMLTFWSYRQQKYWLTALAGMALSATRIVGIILPVVLTFDLIWQTWRSHQFGHRQVWQKILLVASGGLGLLAYMAFLWWKFDDPFMFMSVQQHFGAGRQTGTFILLPQVVWRYAKMFYFGLPWSLKTWSIIQELVLSLVYLGLLAIIFKLNWQKHPLRQPWVWWWFSLLALIIPSLTGSFSSMTRYVLVCVSIPLFLAHWLKTYPRWQISWLIVSLIIMCFNLLLFVQGFWVA